MTLQDNSFSIAWNMQESYCLSPDTNRHCLKAGKAQSSPSFPSKQLLLKTLPSPIKLQVLLPSSCNINIHSVPGLVTPCMTGKCHSKASHFHLCIPSTTKCMLCLWVRTLKRSSIIILVNLNAKSTDMTCQLHPETMSQSKTQSGQTTHFKASRELKAACQTFSAGRPSQAPSLLRQVMASSQQPSSSSDAGLKPPSRPARNAGRGLKGPSKLDSLFSQLQTPVKGLKPPGRASAGSQKQAALTPKSQPRQSRLAEPEKVRS